MNGHEHSGKPQTAAEKHHAALFADGLSDEERLALCLEAAEEYSKDQMLDAARAYRDAAKYRRRTEDSDVWMNDLLQSANLLNTALIEVPSKADDIRRERTGNNLMTGRFLLENGIKRQDMDDVREAYRYLHEGLESLQTSSGRPDQYEVNFAALETMAGHISGADDVATSGIKRVLRLHQLAAISENPERVEHASPELTLKQRLVARGRAAFRAASAGVLVAATERATLPKQGGLVEKLVSKSTA